MQNQIPIFIAHYTLLTERKEFMQNQLKKHNLVAEFITIHDCEFLTENQTNKFDSKLKTGEKSLFLKHIHILHKIIDKNIKIAIIWEDDIKIVDNYYPKLLNYYSQLPEDADGLFSSSGWNKSQNVQRNLVHKYPEKNVFLRTNQGVGINSPLYKAGLFGVGAGSTRTSCEYLVTNGLAKGIIKSFNNEKIINAPYDIWLNRVFRDNNAKIYWGHPTLCDQDQFPSSLK